MKRWLSNSVFLSSLLVVQLIQAEEHPLVGYWKYDEGPTWIEIEFPDALGVGIIKRSDADPEKVADTLLKEIESTGRKDQWRVLIYVQKLDKYKPATITLLTPNTMHILLKIGLISRNVTWQRAGTFE